MPKHLSRQQIAELDAKLDEASAGGDPTWKPWYDKYASQRVLFTFALGEIADPDTPIWGEIWAWNLLGKLRYIPGRANDAIADQGIVKRVQVEDDMVSALLAYRKLGYGRATITPLNANV